VQPHCYTVTAANPVSTLVLLHFRLVIRTIAL